MGHEHEHQDSGNVEYYTPLEIVEAARAAMGSIDLDPATAARVNEEIRASVFFGVDEQYGSFTDGLSMKWFGNVWMNHPFSRGENAKWVAKLVNSYIMGDITQACCITWASMSEKWFEPLLAFPHCIPYGRVHYRNASGETVRGANKGSVITYLGENIDRFAAAFKPIGAVYVPY